MSDDASNLLHRIIAQRRHADIRFESADGSVTAKIDGFIGRNAIGELLISSDLSRIENSFVLKHSLDFTCDLR